MNAPVKILNEPSQIHGMVILEPTIFSDHRGQNFEGFNEGVYYDILKTRFTTFSVSSSLRGVGRGFHGDKISSKLIQILHGYVNFAAIDMREDSPTYKKVFETQLNSFNRKQIFLPNGVVNAHVVTSQEAIFCYFLSHGYVEPEHQIRLPISAIKWPIEPSIVSERDSK